MKNNSLFATVAVLLWTIGSVAQQQPPATDHEHMNHAAMMAQHDQRCAHQHDQASASQPQSPTNPYAGTSAGLTDAQRAQYLDGEGMGFAKPAEMNHYPGPRHVLLNAERMKLTPEQLSATRKLFDSVQIRAKVLGKQIVESEDELLRIFSSGSAHEAQVKQLTAKIGRLQGELRAVHLTAHLQERGLLSAEQIQIYDQARNYIPGEKPAPALHQH